MFRGFYNAAQAMIIQQRELNSVSNNIANSVTPGYRKEHIEVTTFMEHYLLVRGRTQLSGVLRQQYVHNNKVDLEQSNFEFTESRFDMAVWGNVYFNIRDNSENQNILQTRNGQFELDGEGYLCLGKAGRVQGINGDIYIGSDDFVVDVDGVIRNNNGVIDTLLLSYIPPDADVTKVSDTLFRYDGDMAIPEGERFEIIQGGFEKSNADMVKEVARLMEIQRHYEANSAILKYMDTMNSRAVNIAKTTGR